MRRIVVVGTTGSGKSTLAQQISDCLSIDWIDLDALNWLPGWQQASQELFESRVDAATSPTAWVVSGNYSRVRPLVWARADTIIWLDYPFLVVFWRLFKRTFKRAITREELWGTGNRETWGKIFSKDSLFLWFFKTYGRNKRQYPQLFALSQNAHLTVIQHRTPKQTKKWLDKLTG